MKEKIILPPVAALELTYTCNHKCFFCCCPWEADKEYPSPELSFEEWARVIKELALHGVRSFTLTGGEPLMRKDLRKIIELIHRIGASITMISNGRAIDDEFLDFIAERDVSICISLPGIKSFAEHTGVDNVDHVLSLFRKTGERGIRTTANIAVTKKNLPELYENMAYALLNGADYILLNRFLPGGRGLDNSELLLNRTELNQMLDTAEEVLSQAQRYGHVGTELPLCAIDDPSKYKYLQVSNLCAGAKGFFVVDPSGYLKVCNHSPVRVCRYDEIDTLLHNDYWQKFVKRDYLPSMCQGCKFTDKCDGGCREAAHVFYGGVDDLDPILAINK